MSGTDVQLVARVEDLSRRISRIEEKVDLLLAAIDDLDPDEILEIKSTLRELKADLQAGRKNEVFYSIEEAFSDL